MPSPQLPDLSQFLYTHMPFHSPNGNGGVWLFCVRPEQSPAWKLATTLDGQPAILPLPFPEEWNICCPCASWDDGDWDISFIAGPPGGPCHLYSLFLDGARPVADQPIEPKIAANAPADAGFARADWRITATRRGPIVIRRGNFIRKIEIPAIKYLYRIAYNPCQPHQFWITADIGGKYRLIRLDDAPPGNAAEIIGAAGEELYKGVPIGDSAVVYARRDGGFEERSIAICPHTVSTPLQGVEYKDDTSADSLSCIQCFRKHVSAALGFAREIWNGHGAGDHLDHRPDLAAEIAQAELHADALGIEGYKTALRKLRHSLEFTKWDPTQANLDTLRRLWESSLAVNCGCAKK